MSALTEPLRRIPGAVREHPAAADAVLAVTVLALTGQPLLGAQAVAPWAYALVVAECAPLLGRRRRPFATGLAVGALTALHGVVPAPEPVLPWAALIALYGVAAHAERRSALAAAGLVAVLVPLVLLFDGRATGVETFTVNVVIFGTAWLLGDATRHRRDLAALREDRAVAAERARMAREMHDVVAHHVSLMVVQAEAGPALLERSPAKAVAAFDAIGTTGRQALTELRRVLGTLRPTSAERAPVPGVAALPDLLDGVRRAGVRVDQVVTGGARPLSAAGDRAAFRVIQESLTNVVKHAGAGAATVRLDYGERTLHLSVRDDGPGGPTGSGHGLVGMRERVSSLGGRFSAGPAVGGGWSVDAVIPLPERAP